MKSKFLLLEVRDFIKGLIVAMITALLTGLIDVLRSNPVFTWDGFKGILFAGLAAGLAYILKNFFTNSKDQLLTKEQ